MPQIHGETTRSLFTSCTATGKKLICVSETKLNNRTRVVQTALILYELCSPSSNSCYFVLCISVLSASHRIYALPHFCSMNKVHLCDWSWCLYVLIVINGTHQPRMLLLADLLLLSLSATYKTTVSGLVSSYIAKTSGRHCSEARRYFH